MIMSVEIKVLKNREEWLKNRMNGIGGSEASAIIGMNPYMSNIELWQIKTGQLIPEDISEKPYVKYGTEAEPLMRQLFALDYPQYEVGYVENNSYFNDKYPFALASLDGTLIEKETGRKGILEIKTTNILQSMQKEKWDHRIPDNYYIQVLHYLMVTEFDFVVLKAQLKSSFNDDVYLQTRHYKIERAEVEEDIKYLEASERKFWKQVQERKRPALLLPEI
nr:MAG TPA: Exonuclease [Caudoviricetes sp.]